jgi:hypothetical protein
MSNLIVSYNGRKLDRSIHKQSVGSDVVINFDSAVVPINGRLDFIASFTKDEYIDGEEVSYISFPNSFPGVSLQTVLVSYPNSWDSVAWSSSGVAETNETETAKRILFNSPKTPYLNLILGEKPAYSFQIDKNMVNADSKDVLFDISIPRWSHSQKVLFSKIEPHPDLVTKDRSGNLTFSYIIRSGASMKANIEGEIVINETTETLNINSVNSLVENTGYWKIDNDAEYKRSALYFRQNGLDVSSSEGSFSGLETEDERQLFIKLAYQYVLNRFSPAQIDESSLESPLRAGVSSALEKKNGVVPEDYVDFLISILRYFGVPSRMIVGYIPESAGYKSTGFFHTWAEFWDQDTGSWRPLDPALDDTIDSSLFLKKMDEHIAMIQRDESSVQPKLTYFDDGEISVSPTVSKIDEHIDSEIELIINSAKLTSKYIQGDLKITNTGTVPVQLTSVTLLDSDNNEIDSTILSALGDVVVVPGGTFTVPITLDNSAKDSLAREMNLQYSLVDLVGEESTAVKSVKVEIVSYWWWDWLIKLISFIIFTLLTALFYLMFRKVKKIWN